MQLDIRIFAIEIMNRLNTANCAGFAADQQGFGGGHIAFTGDTVQQDQHAAAVGIVSDWAATGLNQSVKQLSDK